MPFVQGKCESCGGILTVDPSLKAANCPFCGSAYIVQDSINHYNTTIKVDNLHADVVNVSDESTSEGRLKAADAYMKLARFDQAEIEFRKVVELVPQNYRGWLGIIEAHTRNYSKRIKSGRELNEVAEWARSFSLFAPAEIKNSVIKKYEAYANGQMQANTAEINAYNDVIQKQQAAIADFEKQIRELTNVYDKNMNTISSLNRKINGFSFSSGKVTALIIAIIVFLIGFYAASIMPFWGIALWIIAGSIGFVLILGGINHSARNNKLRNLQIENTKINTKKAELSAQIQSYRNAIQSNMALVGEYS